MKKLSYLIVLALILGLVLTGCSLLSNIGQAPANEQSGITNLTKGVLDPDPNLVGLWHFDGDALDSSGYDNHGTLVNNPLWEPAGKFSNALSFSSTSKNYVEVTNDNELNPDNVTVEAWVNLSSFASRPHIVGKGTSTVGAYYLVVETSGIVRLFYTLSTGGWHYVGSNTTLSTNTWYHLAGTYDGTYSKVYINGFEVGTMTDPGELKMTDSNNVFIGCGPNAGYGFSDGIIDEVRIWNRALDEGEILDNFNLSKVLIDIKPGSYPNSINLGSNGVVPVAILGAEYFDAATVNPSTVTLAGSGVKVKGHSGNSGSLEDVNGDGYLDLVVQVYTENLELATGDMNAVLNAYTYAGLAITGSDSIRIVKE